MFKIFKISFIIEFIICGFNCLYAQQFGPDIIVENPNINHANKSTPVINLDSQGNPGILWSVTGHNGDSVKFVQSYDQGQTFTSMKIVDTLAFLADAGITEVSLVDFDSLNNPLVFYWRWIFPFSYVHYYKKSFNGGFNFPGKNHSSISDAFMIDYLSYNSNLSFLTHNEYYTINILVKKSDDGGLTYIDSTIVNTNNNSALYSISLVKAWNGDILCFYTGYANDTTNIYYNRSVNEGQNFSTSIAIGNGYRQKNGIYAESYRNYIFIIYRVYSDTSKSKIHFKKSIDHGFTFLPKKLLWDFGSFQPTTHPTPFIVFNPHVGLCAIWTEYSGPVDRTWFTYSFDFGDTFHTPILVEEGHHWRNLRSLAVSDSGDVYVTFLQATDNAIVLKKTKLPVISEIKTKNNTYIKGYQLLPVYPNPFNSEAQISFKIPQASKIILDIYDLMGRRVKTLINEHYHAGIHHLSWNATNQNGGEVTTGIYFVRFSATDFQTAQKILLIK